MTTDAAKPEARDDRQLRRRPPLPTGKIQAQLSGWYTHFTNRQASAFDPELNVSVFRNLGTVNKWGIDGSVAYRADQAPDALCVRIVEQEQDPGQHPDRAARRLARPATPSARRASRASRIAPSPRAIASRARRSTAMASRRPATSVRYRSVSRPSALVRGSSSTTMPPCSAAISASPRRLPAASCRSRSSRPRPRLTGWSTSTLA